MGDNFEQLYRPRNEGSACANRDAPIHANGLYFIQKFVLWCSHVLSFLIDPGVTLSEGTKIFRSNKPNAVFVGFLRTSRPFPASTEQPDLLHLLSVQLLPLSLLWGRVIDGEPFRRRLGILT